jgi:uncharacterized protein YqgC (DUF456 family)
MDAFGVVLIGLLMLLGLLGTLLPIVPGLPIVWGAALVYGLTAGFGGGGTVAFIVITVLAVLGIVGGIVLPHKRMASGGAARSTVWAGIAGGIVGFFIVPVIGLPLGAAVAVYLVERARTSDSSVAWGRTKDLIIGFGLGALLELGAGIAMVGVWVVWVLAAA